MFAHIIDTTGQELATGRVHVEADGTLAITRLEATQADVFVYYFHKGGRDVVVDLGEVRMKGTLGTRMDGTKRLWWVTPCCADARSDALAAGGAQRSA